jgi:hypothetical protein
MEEALPDSIVERPDLRVHIFPDRLFPTLVLTLKEDIMDYLYYFIAGFLIGGIIMFFVFRKNAKTFQEKEKALAETIERLRKATNG